MKTEKILVMINGDRHTVTGEQGKYWLCGDTGFRKLSKQIASVEEVEIPDEDAGAEAEVAPEPEAEPKKKPASRKKKKAEPAEEEQKEGK